MNATLTNNYLPSKIKVCFPNYSSHLNVDVQFEARQADNFRSGIVVVIVDVRGSSTILRQSVGRLVSSVI